MGGFSAIPLDLSRLAVEEWPEKCDLFPLQNPRALRDAKTELSESHPRTCGA